MALQSGTRLGPYEIIGALGAGGMGEVYRATDTNLKRAVAIKVLPESVAADPERLARFQREAEVLALLNHPNIAAIYGLERANGMTALVMELVEGPTLADRIAQGPIPVDEALPIAKQIAEALEAAHEQGIIHRDLKPANIKVRSDGSVKVLDFGLAKALEPAGVVPDASQSPTITSPAMMTGVGVLLGTAAYMSPEQARAKTVNKRSDIWAFGCVLFEMLTGKRAFEGEEVSDTLANVLKSEPDWSVLPSEIPPPIRTLLQSCLTKDPRRRVADISTALFVLDRGASLAPPAGALSAPLARRRPMWQRLVTPVAAALVTSTVVGAGVWFTTRPPPPRVSRLAIALSGDAALYIGGINPDVTITPDGSRVIYVGNRGTQLFVRGIGALEPVAVFTGTPRAPFVSPDGQWIGFVDGNLVLKKVAVTGGPAVTLATFDGNPLSATWGSDDTIVVATAGGTTGLLRVGAAGGAATTVLTRPDRAQGELDHLWPEILPGGRAVLMTITAITGGLDAAQVAVLDLETGTRKVLLHGGSHAQYVPSGHLVYAVSGTLRAVAFDLGALETRGTPVPVIADMVTTFTGAANAAVARDGTLAYVAGGGVAGLNVPRTLVWVDRQGRETPISVPPRPYLYPRLSSDATRVAVTATDQAFDIWVWDLDRTTLTRISVDPEVDNHPVWTADGRRLIFSSERAGTRNLYWQAADGTGAVERLTESPNLQNAGAVSPDGRRLIFTEAVPKMGEDLMQVELDGTHRVTPLVHSSFSERNGVVSPDGRWLAYEANDSGRFEISVRPFPDVNSGHWQVSTEGGTRPLWARNGEELFYVDPSGALMRVGVKRATLWTATTPALLIKRGYFTMTATNPGRMYDISPDGQRFLMMKEGGGDQVATLPSLIVVQHWADELKRLVPTN